MSNALDGLQFPIQSHTNKPSTSRTGHQIIAKALSTIDPQLASQLLSDKKWRKNY